MTVIDKSHNEYTETRSESMQSEIDAAINHAKSDLNNLRSEILWWDKKPDFKTPDCINNFYRLEWSKIIFQLDQVKKYLSEVYKRLQWMKNQKFWEISKENNFTWTILAIQIALKAFETDPLKPRKYNIGKINWEYNEITKNAIKQFQTDFNLQWKDGKPGKETIKNILNVLSELTSNKKAYKETVEKEQNSQREEVMNIVNESISMNSIAWFFTEENKISITNYIIEWNLCTNKDKNIEEQIKSISNHPFNWKLKYLMEHHWEPLKDNIQKIKKIETERKNKLTRTYTNLNQWWTREKAWEDIEDSDENTFHWVKLDKHKAYTVDWVSTRPQWRASSWAFKNCRLTKRLWKVWFDTTIIEHNWTRINRAKYHEETYYSQKVLPWWWLRIPWRHVAEDGTVRDKDGYIVVAADLNYAPKDSIVMTTLWPGKVYDTWDLPKWRFDIYVNR